MTNTSPQPRKKISTPRTLTIKKSGADPSFKKFLDAGKSTSRVLSRVERHFLAKPKDTSRSTTVLHPSEMVRDDWCHRASYYLLQGHAPATSSYSFKTHLVFQNGHAIHSIWQNIFADMGVLYGTWRCRQCGYTSNIIANNPACPLHGENTSWDYMEVPTKSAELRISGKADGILIGFGDPLLLEIKSMSKGTFFFEDRQAWMDAGQDYETAWKNFSSPFLKHIMQAQLYMKLLEGQEIAPKEALFIYYSKPDNDVKEFVVRKSDFGILNLLESAAKIVKAIDNQTPPSCNVKGADLCSKCEVYREV